MAMNAFCAIAVLWILIATPSPHAPCVPWVCSSMTRGRQPVKRVRLVRSKWSSVQIQALPAITVQQVEPIWVSLQPLSASTAVKLV
jgi:hypothetical protein